MGFSLKISGSNVEIYNTEPSFNCALIISFQLWTFVVTVAPLIHMQTDLGEKKRHLKQIAFQWDIL